MNQHPRNQHFLTALMQDLEEASTALKEHRETLETATSEAEARHHYHNGSRCLNGRPIQCPKSRFSRSDTAQTKHQNHIEQQYWNCDFGLECCFKSHQQLLSPRINHCCRCETAWTRSRAASTSTRMLLRQRRRILWLDLTIRCFEELSYTCIKQTVQPVHVFLGVWYKFKSFPNPWPAYELKPKNEK